jgi:hypothetical protein
MYAKETERPFPRSIVEPCNFALASTSDDIELSPLFTREKVSGTVAAGMIV